MKNKFKMPVLDRRSFYILKNGAFLIISMLSVSMLYYNAIVAQADEAVRLFYAVPLAREMIEHTLITLTVIIGSALLCDAVVKNSNNI